MAKRGATSELNDRNWDEEEEPEEAGVFTQATESVLKERVIKKAKRRGVQEGSSTKAFSGFGGFSSSTNSSKEKTSGFSALGSGETIFGSGKSSLVAGASSSVNGSEKEKGLESSKETSYLQGLKSLNESVLGWIRQHVEKNPYIILTPIFRDYEKYLKNLETKQSAAGGAETAESVNSEEGSGNSVGKSSTSTFPKFSTNTGLTFTSNTSSAKGDSESKKEDSQPKSFSFSSSTTESSQTKPFAFGLSTNGNEMKFSTSNTPGSGFQFSKTLSAGSAETASAPAFGKATFSFGATPLSQGQGFSFAGAAKDATSSQSADKDDEEYVPPKPEVREIKEKDALYSKRCKLFYKKEDQWVDRGVGNLHMKPVDEDKTQILIRADTNLGNILLNVMLTDSMPVSRQGKNNVFLVCVPNPPISSKEGAETDTTPVPMLIRVKTGEDADELFNKVEERKKLL